MAGLAFALVAAACGLDARGTAASRATTGGATTTTSGGATTTTGAGGSPTTTTGAGGATASGGAGGATSSGGAGGAGGTTASGGAGGTTTTASVCGDGVIAPDEACDDGNLAPADGCSPTCEVDDFDACPGPLVEVAPGVVVTIDGSTAGLGDDAKASCGGGKGADAFYTVTATAAGSLRVDLDASFGDARLYALDACPKGAELACEGGYTPSFRRAVKAGETMTVVVDADGVGAGELTITFALSPCGDGVIDPDEQCDDGGIDDGDGCDRDCHVECACPEGDCGDGGTLLDPATLHCYALVTHGATFDDAKTACAAWHGSLAKLATLTEIDLVQPLLAQGDMDTWLGATDDAVEGEFVWLDGTALAYTNDDPPWDDGEPNNNGIWPGQEECLEVYPDGLLNDEMCDDDGNAWLCERAPAGAPP